MSDALLENRDYVVILAKSPETPKGSFLPLDRWQVASSSMVALASKCSEFDPDGITVYITVDSLKKYERVKPEQIAGARFDIVDTKVLETIEVDSLSQFLLDIIHD